MKAYKDTIENKTQAVAAAKRHRKLDMLVKGTYTNAKTGKAFKGCSVGCTYKPFEKKVDARNLHALSEPVHGIPEQLTRLRDTLFERLPYEQAKDWHVDFTCSINVGADLSMVMPKLMLWIVQDVQQFAKGKALTSIKAVEKLYQRWIGGDKPSVEEWREARSDAYAADAADAAAYAADAAAYAAYAADAAAYAADAADAADAAARQKFYIKFTAQFLLILKETK